MKIGTTLLSLLLIASTGVAGERVTVTGESSYNQVFMPQLLNIISDRLTAAESFKEAALRISTVCYGQMNQDYFIVDEEVSVESRGGVVTISTTLSLECEKPLPSL